MTWTSARRTLTVHLSMLCVAPMAGCDVSADVVSGPESWLGSDPHLVARGRVNGEEVAIEADPAGQDEVWCERVYTVPSDENDQPQYEAGELTDLRIVGLATVEGEDRILVAELKRHDFQSDTPPAETTIVPRDELTPPERGEVWLEWKWLSISGEPLFESAAQEGLVTLEAYTGSPDDTGLVVPSGEGSAGGLLRARWKPGEEIAMSFTANCTQSEVVLER